MITARNQFAGCVIDDKIYVFGGNGNPDGINLNSGEVYDINSSSWSSIADNSHNGGDGVEEVTGAAVNGKFYVFGGWGGTGPSGYYGVFNFNEVYDPNTDTWTTLAQKPTTTSGAVAAVYDGKIYLFEGYYGYDGTGGSNVNYTVVEVYDPVSNTWQSKANMPKKLDSPAIAVYNDSAYVIGGYDTNAKKMNTEVMVYNFVSNTWTRNYCTAPAYAARAYSQPPVIDGKVYLVGGIEGTLTSSWPIKQFITFDINNRQWQTGASLPEAREGHLTVADNNELYVIGGDTGNQDEPVSTVYCLSNITPIFQFGNLSGTKNTKLAVDDANNVLVTFSLTGGGYGEIIGVPNFDQINLYNTTEKSQLTITSKTETSIGDINSNGPLKGITAKTAELSGSITIGSSSIPKAAVTIVFDRANDLAINSQMPIQSITATEWLGGSINTPSVGSITIKGDKKRGISGDLNDVNLTLSQLPDVKIMALGKLTVNGWIDSSQIISQGNIGTVTAGAMRNSVCFAGVADACLVDVNAADGVLDLPPVLDGTFNEMATIKSIAIKGIKGKDPYFFINSNIAAENVSSIYIAYPQYNNAGAPFGISMYNNPAKTFTIKDANGTHSWKGNNIGTAIDWLTNLGYDMQIRRD